MDYLRTEDEILSFWKNGLEHPIVSICCITYNHEKYIENTLKGFLMQVTDFSFEILIHDDASTDNTQTIIREYEKKYPNLIKPIYQIENQYSKGKKINYIYNYQRAKGKYIALCEGDDYWTDKNKLQSQVEALEAEPMSYMCIHATTVYNVSLGKVDSKIRLNNANKLFQTKEVITGGGEFGQTSSFLFKKEVIQSPPKWYLEASTGDTAIRLLCASKGPIYYLDKDMSIYRRGVIESWTDRVKNSRDGINHWMKSILMLLEYDRYTEYKYSTVIKKRVSQISYIVINNFYSSSDPHIKEFYQYLILRDKLKLKIKIKAPWLFNLVRRYKKLK